MAFLELLGDEPHDGGPGIDDKVALPGGEEVGPAASHVKPAERLQRLSRAENVPINVIITAVFLLYFVV